ncbi:hypothetical protein MPSEU_000925800 [Mayamaea pseudoterrestris]|nr:hypothetical protein MPSEU_000925800 [Mayamaea pseudoterrestris]
MASSLPSSSSITISDTPLWEKCKENAAPLERGRNVVVLEQSFQTASSDKDATIRHYESIVQRYERQSANQTLSEDDDPLIHWLSYTKFYQESFPADKNGQFLLMERCFRTMMKHEKYCDDPRYIRVCCLYAVMSSREQEIFRFMYQQHIGLRTAAFWAAWAFKAEKDGDFKKANEILTMGLEKYKAHPLQVLQQRYLQFQRRFVKHLANQQDAELVELEEYAQETQRGALGGLSREATRRNDRSQMSAYASSSHSRFESSTATYRDTSRSHQRGYDENVFTAAGGFAIYTDEHTSNSRNMFDDSFSTGRTDRVLEREKDLRKENTLAAERWNERGGLSRSVYDNPFDVSMRSQHQAPSFSVHIDEEHVAQHQREEDYRQTRAHHMRKNRDERAFQERGDGSSHIAEMLSKDPLRYLKDPSLMVSDKSVAETVVASNANRSSSKAYALKMPLVSKSVGRQRPALIPVDPTKGFHPSLLVNSRGVEQCFEEARANARYYKLAPSSENFNLFHKPVFINDSFNANLESDVSMETATIHFTMPMLVHPPAAPLEPETQPGVAQSDSLVLQDTFDNDNAKSASMDGLRHVHGNSIGQRSHVVDARQVYLPSNGLPPRPHIQTIPYEDKSYESSFQSAGRSYESSFHSAASSTVDEAIAVGGPLRKEEQTLNAAAASKDISMMFSSPAPAPIAEASRYGERSIDDAMVNLENGNSFLRRDIKVGHSNEARGRKGIEFQIFCETAGDSIEGADVSAIASPTMRHEQTPAGIQAQTNASGMGFTIFEGVSQDSDERREAGAVGANEAATPTGLLDKILGDDSSDDQSSIASGDQLGTGRQLDLPIKQLPRRARGEETADISDLIGCLSSPTEIGDRLSELPLKQLRARGEETADISDLSGCLSSPTETTDRLSKLPFNQLPRRARGEETADISDLIGCLSSPTEIGNGYGRSLTTVEEEPSMFDRHLSTDVDNINMQALDGNICPDDTTALSKFGDLSGIAYADDDATMTVNLNLAMKGSISHSKHFESEIKSAVQRLKARGRGHFPVGASLTEVLASEGLIVTCPSEVIPRVFKTPKISNGTEITFGKKKAIIKCELGRGAFGIVVLLETGAAGNTIAVKVQQPTESLAVEYEIMSKITERLHSRESAAMAYFPRPLAYLAAASGAMMSMTAASSSGVSVVDLVNVYKTRLKCNVPGILALHYTSRMLHHLELLHWRAKILHCDTKADNWILSKSDLLSTGMPVDGAELTLVDFGRAVDLESLAKQADTGPMEVMLNGIESPTEMQCVAMRKGLPWSYDIDTVGVCATAHVLLFGKHMAIAQDVKKRWMPSEPFKHDDQQQLWIAIFGSLLNLDDVSKTAIGSHPNSVRRLRAQIETFLSIRQDQLMDALQKQAQVLPSSRQELYE